MEGSTPLITTSVVVAAVVIGAGRVIELEYDEGFSEMEVRRDGGTLLDVGSTSVSEVV